MKIALVSPYDYPYPGGVTEHITYLDRYFRALGHDTRILAASSTDEDVLGEHVIKVSGAVSPVPFSGSTARITLSPQVYRRVKKILKDQAFDVVHVHEPGAPILSLTVLRHSHALNVGTFHAYRETSTLFEYAAPFLRRVFNRLDGRIFVSEAVRDYILRYFPGAYVMIPNGIDCARFGSPEVKPIERFDDGRSNILFVGRLEKRKGFRHLLRAFPYIKQAVPDARLLVVGAYRDRDKAPYLRYARGHRLRGIHFVGYVAPEELPRYYRTATVLCAPSTGFESFGIILLEGMAAGLPVVASDIAGYRSVLRDCEDGQLVPPGDEQAIARAVVALLRDPAQRARMGESGRRTAASYDWSLIARRVLEYYDELLEERAAMLRIERSSGGPQRLSRVRHLLSWRGGRRKRGGAP